jgi:hypothetical protein
MMGVREIVFYVKFSCLGLHVWLLDGLFISSLKTLRTVCQGCEDVLANEDIEDTSFVRTGKTMN